MRPNDAATLHRYALNLGYFAAQQLGRSDPKLALTYGQKVLQIETKLQQESPKTQYAGGLAFAYSVLVDLFFKDIHDYASARSYAERQLLGGQQAVRLDPRNEMLQRLLAAQYLYLAEVDSKTGRLSQSLEGLKKGQAIARAMIEADPENVPNRGVLADNLSFTGQVLLLARKPKDAFGQLDEARALYEPFPKTDSKAKVSSIKAAICLVKMGEAAGQMGKPVLAETYFRNSLGSVESRLAPSANRDALFTVAAAYAGLGIRYAARSGYLYYTSTSQQLMMRVPVNQETLDPAGLPEFVAGGRYWDDFGLDEEAEIAYVTTYRENTIDHVLMRADGNRAGFTVAAGNPFTETLVGPSSGVWRRGPGDYGRVAYFTTDGGTAQSPDGVSRTAKLLRVTFPRVDVNRYE